MNATLGLVGTWVLLAAVSTPVAPSVKDQSMAVLGITAKRGVHEDAAALLSTHVVSKVRASGLFGRVVSTSELKTALSFEAQKQLNNCDSTGCMAEIAGALGVDFILAGELGRLGDTWMLSLTIIESKTGLAVSSVSRAVEGLSEATLITAVEGALSEVLRAFASGGSRPAPDNTAQREQPGPATPVTVAAPAEEGRPASRILMFTGAGGLALAAAAGVGFLVAGLVTSLAVVLPFLIYLPLPVARGSRDGVFNAAILLGGSVTVAAGLAVLLVGAGGGGALISSWLVPG